VARRQVARAGRATPDRVIVHPKAAVAACGGKLVVVDQTEMTDDLVQDMVDVLTSFCARLYGHRAAKNRAAKALAAAQAEP
jgi:putative resolvase